MQRRTSTLTVLLLGSGVLTAGFLWMGGLVGLPQKPALAGPDTLTFGLLEGTWKVVIRFDPSFGIPDVTNYASFTRDGRLINVDPATTGVGEWKRLSAQDYAITFWAFSHDDPVQHKVRGTLTLDPRGEHAAGPFVTDVFDLNGDPLASVFGTVALTRLTVERL